MKYRHVLLITLLALLFHCETVQAASTDIFLKSIHHSVLSPHKEQVILQFTGPSKLKQFTLQGERPRLVFDFPDVLQARTVKNVIQVDSPLLKRIRIGTHLGDTPKTRVVFDMGDAAPFPHTHRLDEAANTLTITLGDGQGAAPAKEVKSPEERISPEPANRPPVVTEPLPQPAKPAKPAKTVIEQPPAVQQRETIKLPPPTGKPSPLLKEVEYKPDSGKGEMVLFHLNGFYPPIVYGVEEGTPRAVCDFKKAQLGERVKNLKKINARYVRSIRVGEHRNPDKVRVVIDLQPNNIYDLQQVFFRKDNLFMIIVNTAGN